MIAPESAPQLPLWLEVSAMSISGFFGGLIAGKRGAPILGILLGGVLFGLGGGLVRDVLLNVMPTSISQWYLIPAVSLTALAGGFSSRFLSLSQTPVLLIQAIYLSLLLLIGAEKAANFGVSGWAVIALGLVTAMAGGAMLDALSGQRAALLSQGQWHITALLAGGVGFLVLFHYSSPLVAEIGTMVIIISLRMMSVQHGWQCPEFPGKDAIK